MSSRPCVRRRIDRVKETRGTDHIASQNPQSGRNAYDARFVPLVWRLGCMKMKMRDVENKRNDLSAAWKRDVPGPMTGADALIRSD